MVTLQELIEETRHRLNVRIDHRPKNIARDLNADATLTDEQRDAEYLRRVAALPPFEVNS